jgi:hypothetical protein
VTRPDAEALASEALAAALEAATGQRWETLCVGGCRLPHPPGGGLMVVDCWRRGGTRVVAIMTTFSGPHLERDIPHGRGWPARAAAAVVAMLGER